MTTEIQILEISLPLVLLFGGALWAMIFMQTYSHFPKMDSAQRLWLCFQNATIVTLILLVFVYVMLYLVTQNFLK